jgi:hypothetical protein
LTLENHPRVLAYAKNQRRNFGSREGRAPLFNRCLVVRPSIPDSVEIILKPGAWGSVLIHTPEISTGFPLPMGFITSDPSIAVDLRRALAEVAAEANGSKAVLWSNGEETLAMALAYIDLALGIGEA